MGIESSSYRLTVLNIIWSVFILIIDLLLQRPYLFVISALQTPFVLIIFDVDITNFFWVTSNFYSYILSFVIFWGRCRPLELFFEVNKWLSYNFMTSEKLTSESQGIGILNLVFTWHIFFQWTLVGAHVTIVKAVRKVIIIRGGRLLMVKLLVFFVKAYFLLGTRLGFLNWSLFLNELSFDQNFSNNLRAGVHEFEPIWEIAIFSHLLHLYLSKPV